MPVPNSMADLATLAGSNFPTGTEAIGNSLDNYLRATQAILRSTYATATANIASASTVDIGAADAERVVVTGSVTITSFGNGFVGCKREVAFTGAPTLTHSSSIYLPGLVNITVVPNDVLTFRCTAVGQWTLMGASRPASLGLTAVVGYVPANLAGASFSGNVSIPANGLEVGSTQLRCASGKVGVNTSGTLGSFNVGNGRSFFGGSGELFQIGLGYTNTRSQAGQVYYLGASDSTTPDLVFSNAGGIEQARLGYGGGLTLAGGRKLQKITLSASAPGALADGELYLRY